MGAYDRIEKRVTLRAPISRVWHAITDAPLLVTAPGLGWINAYTIASEIGNIERFPSPTQLCGYTGLCPRVVQSGSTDRRGPISKHGPRYLRWALFEAARRIRRGQSPGRSCGS